MKNASILFLFCTLVLASSAHKGDSVIFAQEFKKNELSINGVHTLRTLMNLGNELSNRFSVTYKRNLSNKHSALRVSLVADLISSKRYNGKATFRWSYTMIDQQYSYTSSYWSPHLNMGYEQHFGRKKLKFFYGADLTFGYSESKSVTQYYKTFIDSIYGNPYIREEYQKGQDLVSRKKTYSVGLNPFFGAKYPISRHFSISMQLGADVVYRVSDVSEKSPTVDKKMRVSTFDFYQATGIVNDISLVYKF